MRYSQTQTHSISIIIIIKVNVLVKLKKVIYLLLTHSYPTILEGNLNQFALVIINLKLVFI